MADNDLGVNKDIPGVGYKFIPLYMSSNTIKIVNMSLYVPLKNKICVGFDINLYKNKLHFFFLWKIFKDQSLHYKTKLRKK